MRPFCVLPIIFVLNLCYSATITSNTLASQSSTQSLLSITPVAQDIDRFLRLGYSQLSSATLSNLQILNNQYLFAYLVPNGSVFIINTEYIPSVYSIKILGVLELTGVSRETAAGIRRASSPPSSQR